MISRTVMLGMLGLGLAACGSAPSPNWVAVEMSDPPGQFYIDLANAKTLDSGNKVADIYIETPDNPDTSRAEASLELNCTSNTLRVTKSIMVRRASGIRVDLTRYPTSDNWVNPHQVGFSDIYNYVCKKQGEANLAPGTPEQILPAAEEKDDSSDPSGIPAQSADLRTMSCDQLWYARNAIFAEKGQCFKTRRAIAAFGPRCHPPYGDLTQSERIRVSEISYWEGQAGCSSN